MGLEQDLFSVQVLRHSEEASSVNMILGRIRATEHRHLANAVTCCAVQSSLRAGKGLI